MTEYDPYRKCHSCGFRGYMDRWFTKSVYPFLISFILLILGLIPGILFIAWNRHKLICPECGSIRE